MHNSKTRNLTDAQWALVAPLIPVSRRNGPPFRDRRDVLNAILFVLRTRIAWNDLPKRYPSPRTCRRCLAAWSRSGTITKLIKALAADLKTSGGVDVERLLESRIPAAHPLDTAALGGPTGPSAWTAQTADLLLSLATQSVLRQL